MLFPSVRKLFLFVQDVESLFSVWQRKPKVDNLLLSKQEFFCHKPLDIPRSTSSSPLTVCVSQSTSGLNVHDIFCYHGFVVNLCGLRSTFLFQSDNCPSCKVNAPTLLYLIFLYSACSPDLILKSICHICFVQSIR